MKLTLSNKIFFAEVERLLADGESVTITIRGNSMRPWLRDGKHKVVLRHCSGQDLQVGDIALFRYHEAHVLHRVVEIAGNQITFAGDGNIGQREQVAFDKVIASAESIILPNGRVVACSSREWRIKSKIWLSLPQLARRIVLAIMHRI